MFSRAKHKSKKLAGNKRYLMITAVLALVTAIMLGFFLQRSGLKLESPYFNNKAFRYDYKQENRISGTTGVNQQFTVNGVIYFDAFKQHIVNLVPDDCLQAIKVNGRPLDLSGYSGKQLCDINKGIDFDLGKYLRQGNNQIIFTLKNNQLGASLVLKDSTQDNLFRLTILAIVLTMGIAAYNLLALAGLARSMRLILVGALALLLVYLSFTSFETSRYDLGWHLQYIEIVANKHYLPQQSECFECFQPPLYYMSAAGLLNLSKSLGINTMVAMQLYALLFTMVTLYVTALILQENLKQRRSVLVALAAVAFFPQVILHGIEISNDIPMYTAAAVLVLFTLRWWRSAKLSDLRWALITLLIGMFIKSTMIVPGALLGVLLLIRLWQQHSWKGAKKLLWSYRSLIIFIVVFIALFAVYRIKIPNMGKGTWPVENVENMPAYLKVVNTPQNLFTINFNSYFGINRIDDKPGNVYLMNYFLKSALFGRGIDSFVLPPLLIHTSEVTLLVLLVIMLYALIRSLLRRKYLVFVLLFALWLASFYASRLVNPYVPVGDFRLIQPVVLPAGLLLGSLVSRDNPKLLRIFITAFVIFWVLLTVVSYTANYWYRP